VNGQDAATALGGQAGESSAPVEVGKANASGLKPLKEERTLLSERKLRSVRTAFFSNLETEQPLCVSV